MKRLLVAGAVGVALTTAALPAHAHPTRHYEGGCGYDTISDSTGLLGGGDRYSGVAYVLVLATDASGVPRPSASIAIDCEIYVNGVLADVAASASGTGAAAAAGTFSFTAGDTDFVQLCERAVIDGEEDFTCGFEDPPPFPPPLIQVLVNLLNDGFFEPVVDPVVCPLFGSLAPGVPGVLDITPEGDASVLGARFWDCPPYGD